MQVSSTGGNTFTFKAFLPVPVVKEVLVTRQTHFKSDLLILCIETLHPQGLGGEPLWRSVFLKPCSTQPLVPAWLHPLVLVKQGLISKTGQVQCLVLSLWEGAHPYTLRWAHWLFLLDSLDFFSWLLQIPWSGTWYLMKCYVTNTTEEKCSTTHRLSDLQFPWCPQGLCNRKVSFQMHTPWQQTLAVSTSWSFCALES